MDVVTDAKYMYYWLGPMWYMCTYMYIEWTDVQVHVYVYHNAIGGQ